MRTINIKIVKLPPEANALAKKIEDTLSKMIAKAIKSRVGTDGDLENLEITVYESIIKELS